MSYRPVMKYNNTNMVKRNRLAGDSATTDITLTGIATNDVILYAQVVTDKTTDEFFKRVTLQGDSANTGLVVSGIKATDKLVEVLVWVFDTDGYTDILDKTSDATITDDDEIKLAITDTTDDKVIVTWLAVDDLPVTKDITSQISITDDDKIQVSTDDTTGFIIDIKWLDVSAAEVKYN